MTTIIVLLILTGVALSLVMGDNGLLNRTETAVDEHEKQSAKEKLSLKITECEIEYYGEKGSMPGLAYLAAFLKNDPEIDDVKQKSEDFAKLALLDDNLVEPYETWSSIYTKLKAYPYVFEINSDLQLASVDGVKIATSSGGVDEAKVQAMITTALAEYSKTSEIESNYATKTDLNGYAKTSDLNYITSTEVDTKIETALSNLGSSGGESATVSTLYSGSINTEGTTYTLSDSILNYDLLIFKTLQTIDGEDNYHDDILWTDGIVVGSSGNPYYEVGYNSGIWDNRYSTAFKFRFTQNNKLKLIYLDLTDFPSAKIFKIIGIKF